MLVLRCAAPGQLPQFEVAGQRLVHGLAREGDGRTVRQRVGDPDRGRQLLRGVARPVPLGQRQARGHPPRLPREDRRQGGLDGLPGHDLIVLIDEDDLERPCRVESGAVQSRPRAIRGFHSCQVKHFVVTSRKIVKNRVGK